MNKFKDKIKNLFAKKKPNNYFDKQGFFAIAVLCLGVIAVTALMLNSDLSSSENDALKQADAINSQAAQNVQQIEGGGLDEQLSTASPAITIGEIITTDDSAQANSSSDQAKPTTSASTNYVAPINGTIILDYSDKALIYSKTLKQWTTHMGIDISANKGDNVKAMAAGTVEDAYKDNMKGYTVIIDHGNGLKSIYANLESADKVKKGDTVKQGNIIGTVGESAIFEIKDDTHLHFEVKLNGKNVNPNNYFKLPVKETTTAAPASTATT